jgi:hypothetical protein
VRCFHFNYLLFVPIWLARQILRVLDINVSSENQITTGLLNRLLNRVFDLDVRTAPWLALPFGVSIFMLAEKPTGSGVGEQSVDARRFGRDRSKPAEPIRVWSAFSTRSPQPH